MWEKKPVLRLQCICGTTQSLPDRVLLLEFVSSSPSHPPWHTPLQWQWSGAQWYWGQRRESQGQVEVGRNSYGIRFYIIIVDVQTMYGLLESVFL